MENKVHLVTILLIVSAILIGVGVFLLQGDDFSRLEEVKNSQRQKDMNNIVNAVYQYSLEHDGLLPSEITDVEQEMCASMLGCEGFLDLREDLQKTKHIIKTPVDPDNKEGDGSGYTIKKEEDGSITVKSLNSDILINR